MIPSSIPRRRVGLPCVILLGVLPACRSTVQLQDFDQVARTTDSQTIVLGEGYSLYSPYDVIATRGYSKLVEEQIDDLFALFEVESELPVLVWLQPDEDMGLQMTVEPGNFRIEGVSLEPKSGLLGRAGDRVALIAVAPVQYMLTADGTRIPGTLDASMYQDTIRHELAHVATNLLLGKAESPWFHEGVAHLVEWVPIREGRPILDPVSAKFRHALELPPEMRSLASMLGWSQNPERATRVDRIARAHAFTFVAFFLERERAPSFREGLLRLATLSEADVLALEPEWSSWLDALAGASGS